LDNKYAFLFVILNECDCPFVSEIVLGFAFLAWRWNLERKARDAIYNNGVVIATASFSEVTATRRRWPKNWT